MNDPARRLVTYADLEALPDEVIGEIVAGELHASPRPAMPHNGVVTALASALFGPFRRGIGGPGGWVIRFEPEVHLGTDVLVPDLAGWRRERMGNDALEAAAVSIAPDWVCEVLSPRTARFDRVTKLPAYGAHGVGFAWLIDPALQTLEVYRRESTHWVLEGVHAGNASVRAVPFDAIEIELEALWRG